MHMKREESGVFLSTARTCNNMARTHTNDRALYKDMGCTLVAVLVFGSFEAEVGLVFG